MVVTTVPTFLVNPYIHLKTDAINMLTRWLATDRPVWKCTMPYADIYRLILA